MSEEKRKFLAWLNNYGLQEYEGRGFFSNVCIVEGNSMDEIIHDYCDKTETNFNDLKKNEDGSYSYLAMGIWFCPITEEYDINNKVPIINPMQICRNPFAQRPYKKFDHVFESKYWDHEKSFAELMEPISEVILNMNFKSHKSDDCYSGICMYIPILEGSRAGKDLLEIGVSRDGFTYNGTTYLSKDAKRTNHNYVIDKATAIKIMQRYRKLMANREKLESLLLSARTSVGQHIDETCINIIIKDGYELENKSWNEGDK